MGWGKESSSRREVLSPLEGEEVHVVGGVEGGGHAEDVVRDREAAPQLGAVFDVVHEQRRVVQLRRRREASARTHNAATTEGRKGGRKTADALEARGANDALGK